MFFSSPRPKRPWSCHVVEEFMLTRPPRVCGQVDGSVPMHPPSVLFAEITHTSPTAVETRTLAVCAGVPTWISKVAQGPSLPSLHIESENNVSNNKT